VIKKWFYFRKKSDALPQLAFSFIFFERMVDIALEKEYNYRIKPVYKF